MQKLTSTPHSTQSADFKKSILDTARQKIPHITSFTTTKGTVIPVYKGTIQQTNEGFTFIKVHNKFISELAIVAKERLSENFEEAPYIKPELVGAHISLGKTSILSSQDKGQEVYFQLTPTIEDFEQYGGSLLNGRVLTVGARILGGDGINTMKKYHFSLEEPYHITFAIQKK